MVIGTKVYYRSIHMFLDSARDYAQTESARALRKGLNQCLLGTAMTWFTHQLSRQNREWIRGGKGIKRWHTKLFDKFKTSTTKALLDKEGYDQDSVRNGRPIGEYVMTVMRLAKEANAKTRTSRLLVAWWRIAPVLRREIHKPNEYTTLDAFVEECEAHAESWEEIYVPRKGKPKASSKADNARPTRNGGQANQGQPTKTHQPGYRRVANHRVRCPGFYLEGVCVPPMALHYIRDSCGDQRTRPYSLFGYRMRTLHRR